MFPDKIPPAFKPKYFCNEMGYGLFEQKDTVLFMKYYLDFGEKYFNEDISKYEFTEYDEKYFAMHSPLHSADYIMQPFYAGLRRNRTLFVRLKDDKMMFIKNLIEDRNDMIAHRALNPRIERLLSLLQSLEDTNRLLGSDLYNNSLAYYRSLREAAKVNAVGASAKYSDLKQQFPGAPKKSSRNAAEENE
jgi:hypothetical protein